MAGKKFMLAGKETDLHLTQANVKYWARCSIFRASVVRDWCCLYKACRKRNIINFKIEGRILPERQKCPTPIHLCSLVLNLCLIMSLIGMSDSLHLSNPVLSVKGRGHLANSSFYHFLAHIIKSI